MKLIPGNISSVKKRFLLLVLLPVMGVPVFAQHTTGDTTASPPAYEDSAIAGEQTNTIGEKVNYFDQLDSHSVADTFQLREVPARVIDSLKKDDAFWYADKAFPKKKAGEKEQKEVKLPSQWLNMTMLVIIVVIFIGLLAWYLFQNNIIRRMRRVDQREESQEMAAENIFEIDYREQIEKAVGASNYRFAIRLMFLRLLKDLSEKNIIRYRQERTNFDYLSQLSGSVYYRDFFRLTRNYEYVWYGKFDVGKESFGIIQNDFENFDRKL